MKIDLTEIYASLKAWRDKRGITAQSQKEGYLVNVMEEFGELAQALRDYEKLKNAGLYTYAAEHSIIDALCDIAVFTINAGANIPYNYKLEEIDITKLWDMISYDDLLIDIGKFGRDCDDGLYFNETLKDCCKLSMDFNFDFEIAMNEKIKEISSHDEAKKADYEKARIKK